MKKILVLWWYGNIWQVVIKDLIDSWFFVWIAWRDNYKIDNFIKKLKGNNYEKVIIDLKNELSLMEIFKKYDLVVNCLEYTYNQVILDLCIKTWKNYVDLWDDYNWIKTSISKNSLAKKNKITACLWAWSSPWIVNILTKYAVKEMKKIETITISFSDEIKNTPKNMLPFNFATVVEEILWDALVFEDWKYKFVKWSTVRIDADFCRIWTDNNSCLLPWSYITNHDEQLSLPDYLKEKWIQNVYFVMKHSENVISLVKSLNEFWFLDKQKINIKWVEISPFEFTNMIMSKFAPQNFLVDDKESLFIKLDEKIVEIVNYSVDWVPAWVVNTWIGCSLISQYISNNNLARWVHHPEDLVNDKWFINELKKRKFEIYIDWKNI